MSTRTRRVKWHPTPPPPPSPKIINLPRRCRRKKPRNAVKKQPISAAVSKGKLESLFGEEREFARAPVVVLNSLDRRDRVEEVVEVEEEDGGGGGLAEEKWRFQAEILRAECNFLRMERKFALKKLERNRLQMEKTLKSALQNLASGRKKIYEGKNMEVVLEEEIKELAEKLEELQSSYNGGKDLELRKCKNFDKKASRLQRRLEKLGGLSDERCSSEIKEVNEASTQFQSINETNEDSFLSGCNHETKSSDVEILKRKVEGLSKGMLDRMEEEYGSILLTTANSSVASSASTSKRIEFPDHSSFSDRHSNQPKEQLMVHEGNNKCSGRCKVLVRRIVEQVRAETEQWSQMQEMLGQLRQEMEELQTSRDFWETQALASTNDIDSLQSSVEEWREKAMNFETKTNELQTEISLLKDELEKLTKDQIKDFTSTPKKTAMISLGKQLEKEKKHVLICRTKGNCDNSSTDKENNKQEIKELSKETKTGKESQPLSLGKQLAREKRILICRLKENNQINKGILDEGRRKVRSPFRDIGNSSTSTPLPRQNSNAVFPLH